MPVKPEIKICGLTKTDEAVECAMAGADAIGFVFYPPSPRNITPQKAREISMALPDNVSRVGVFVNSGFSDIMRIADYCMLNSVQLHGQESPGSVKSLKDSGLSVIKTLFIHKMPFTMAAQSYNAASAFLVECGKGRLPGGNSLVWNWKDVLQFGLNYPLILAGGLRPETIFQAVSDACPAAVDVSSGVESHPGHKSIDKVKAFVRAISTLPVERKLRKIFSS